MTLYTPPDTDEANAAWGANCGPCSLAAALGVPVSAVREAVSKPGKGSTQGALPGLEQPHRFPGYMGIRDLRRAVERAGALVGREWSPFVPADAGAHPVLVMVNWTGPWDGTRGAASYRHVIVLRRGHFPLSDAYLHIPEEDRWPGAMGMTDAERKATLDRKSGPEWVYDVNVGWVPMQTWRRVVPPGLQPKRSTGWRFSWGGEVRRVLPGRWLDDGGVGELATFDLDVAGAYPKGDQVVLELPDEDGPRRWECTVLGEQLPLSADLPASVLVRTVRTR